MCGHRILWIESTGHLEYNVCQLLLHFSALMVFLMFHVVLLYDSNSIVTKTIDLIIKGHIVDSLCRWWKRVNDHTDNVLYTWMTMAAVNMGKLYSTASSRIANLRNVFSGYIFFSIFCRFDNRVANVHFKELNFAVQRQHTNTRRAHAHT